jgi:outer membrane protein TolC
LPNNPLALGTANQMSWSVSQNVQWLGKRRLAGEIAQAQANSTQEQVAYVKVQLLGQLQTTWAAWQQTWTQIQLSELQAQRLEQIKDIIRLRYGSNAAAYVDFINAQVTQAQIRSDIIGQKRQLQTYQAQIAALIGQPVKEAPVKLTIAPVTPQRELVTMETFQQRALEVNPQVRASHELVVAAERNVELAQLGKWPDFNVAIQANSSNPPWGFGERQSYGFALTATVPLYYGMKEGQLLDQAKAQLGAAREADESLVQQIDLAVQSAYLQWAQSIDQLKLIEDRVVAQARVGYRMALTNYSTTQASYVDLLNAYNALRAAEISALQAQASALQSRVALDLAVGEIQNK